MPMGSTQQYAFKGGNPTPPPPPPPPAGQTCGSYCAKVYVDLYYCVQVFAYVYARMCVRMRLQHVQRAFRALSS